MVVGDHVISHISTSTAQHNLSRTHAQPGQHVQFLAKKLSISTIDILSRRTETIKRVTLKTRLESRLFSTMPIFCAQIENNTEEIKYRTEPNQYSAITAIQLLTG